MGQVNWRAHTARSPTAPRIEACTGSCTCSHLPHLERPTTHFIVMSCFTYVVVVQPITAIHLTCMQHDDAYLILSRAPLVHETCFERPVPYSDTAVGWAIIIISNFRPALTATLQHSPFHSSILHNLYHYATTHRHRHHRQHPPVSRNPACFA
jgi:hypothetical protein